jgi:hypothetical protein
MTTVAEAIDIVARRVRDQENIAHPRPVVMALLSQAQRLLNTRLALFVHEYPFLLQPYQQFYGQLSTVFPDLARPVGFHDGKKELQKGEWNKLHHYRRDWFRALGGAPLVWCPMGRDALVIHPALDHLYEITMHGVPLTAQLGSEIDLFEIHDQYMPLVYDFTETILLAKQRVLDSNFQASYDRLFGRFVNQDESRRTRISAAPVQRASGPDRNG